MVTDHVRLFWGVDQDDDLKPQLTKMDYTVDHEGSFISGILGPARSVIKDLLTVAINKVPNTKETNFLAPPPHDRGSINYLWQ